LIDIAHRTFKKNIGHYLTGSLMTWTVIALAHLWFIRKLPLYYILQCFSLLKSYQQSGYAASTSIAQNTVNFLQGTILSIVSFWPFLILAIIVMIFFLFLITLLVKDEKRSFWRTEAFLALITVVIFMFFSLHEAFLSIMPYARYWAQVFEFSFIFLVIGLMIKKIPRLLQAILAIFFIVLLGFNAVRFHQIIRFFKNPGYHFQLGKNNAYVTNPPSWFATVHQTVSFLNSNLNDKELFFVLPYEPIYYFLANKKSPTREIEFFTFMNTTPEQEQKIILRLEQNNVNYIVLSNRCQSTEAGLGTLGQTYCPLLARYILDNFIAIETFGDWNKPAGWVDNHAVRIFKRKNLPTP
jgi:hypothetical protein